MEPIGIPALAWLAGLLIMICGVDENKKWQKVTGAIIVGLAAALNICLLLSNVGGNG